MTQPIWRCIAQLGDASPTEHGGHWVFIDETSVYPPEAEVLFVYDHGPSRVYRYPLDRCTFIDGVLSHNKYHPDYCAWWATTSEKMKARPQDGKGLTDLASYMGVAEEELVEMFCSDDPVQRAMAYEAAGQYHGFNNFDDYPLELTQSEVEARYADERYKVQ